MPQTYIAKHRTAVVILSYNSLSWHELFLPKIVEESHGQYDVVLIDHCTTDHTVDYVQRNFPTIHIIQLQRNNGFAWGYHEGLKQIQAEFYILLSSDFEVTTAWHQLLIQFMDAHPDVGAVQPKIKFYKDKRYFEYAGGSGGFIDNWGYLFCRGRVFDTLEMDEGQYNDNIRVFWASGGCFMVRSAVYHEAGGLDEDFFAHMEEVDLCWRIQHNGHKIAVCPKSQVYHVGGSIISYGSPQKTFYNFRNSFYLFIKNEKSSKLLWLIPLRLVLDGLAGIQFLLKGQFKNVTAIIKAHFSFYKNFNVLLSKRKNITFNHENVYRSQINILSEYYFNKKKKFKALKIKTTKI